MTSLSSYYILLSIPETASVEEIKKAFRVKAKHYHPDVNKNPDAAVQFRNIHEAYEILIHHKTGMGFNNAKQKYQYTAFSKDQMAAAARDRADVFAKKSYQEYKKSGYYSKGKLIKEAAVFIELVFYIVTIFFIPIGLSFFIGTAAGYFCLGAAVLMMPQWIQIIPAVSNLSWDRVKQGMDLAYFPRVTIHWILIPFSIICYFTIGFKTMITFGEILIFYAVCVVISLLFLRLKKRYSIGRAISGSLSYGFATLSFILLLNYLISFQTQDEIYRYQTTSIRYARRSGDSYRGKGSMIILLNEQGYEVYNEYTSIRFFWEYDDIPYGNGRIKYITKRGLFNINVYTERTFLVFKPEDE